MKIYNFGEITKIKTGKLDANAKVEGGKYPFFTCSKEISWIDTASYDCECILVAGNGDLNVKYYHGKFDAYQRTYIIEANGAEELDMKYLYYFIDGYMETLRSQTIGGVIQYIKMNNLTDIQIPIPPLSAQHAIAERLDQIQELIDLKKQALSKTDELAKAIFLEMFGDPMVNEKGWELRKLGDVSSVSTGRTPSTEITEYRQGNIPRINTGEIKNFFIENTGNYISEIAVQENMMKIYFPGTILIAMYGQGITRGKVGLLQIKATINQAFAAINANHKIIYNRFLLYYLHFSYETIRGFGRGGNQPNLNLSIVKDIQIFFPPLPLQEYFADLITEIEAQKNEHKQALTKLEELYQAEMQRSFSL